jgi:small multidrug resistance pump
MGIVLISVVAWLVYDQRLDLPAITGIILILIGVFVMQAFSKSVAH